MDSSQIDSKDFHNSWEIVDSSEEDLSIQLCSSLYESFSHVEMEDICDADLIVSHFELKIRRVLADYKINYEQLISKKMKKGSICGLTSTTNSSRLYSTVFDDSLREIILELENMRKIVRQSLEFDMRYKGEDDYDTKNEVQRWKNGKAMQSSEERGLSRDFWRDLIIFVRNLLVLLVKEPQGVGLRNVSVDKTGRINISEMKIRKQQLGYWPPEVFRDEKQNEKSLVYTLGAFIIHLITEKAPFHQYDYPPLMYNVGKGRLLLVPPVDCDPLLASIIAQCCRFNQERRPTFQELYNGHFAATEALERQIIDV